MRNEQDEFAGNDSEQFGKGVDSCWDFIDVNDDAFKWLERTPDQTELGRTQGRVRDGAYGRGLRCSLTNALAYKQYRTESRIDEASRADQREERKSAWPRKKETFARSKRLESAFVIGNPASARALRNSSLV